VDDDNDGREAATAASSAVDDDGETKEQEEEEGNVGSNHSEICWCCSDEGDGTSVETTAMGGASTKQ